MKIKIGDKIVSVSDEPIMIIFDDEKEKLLIINHLSNMSTKSKKYCMFPDIINKKDIKKFMIT